MNSDIFLFVDVLLDILFLIDMILNFFACYHDTSDNLVTDFRKIIKKYFKFFISFKRN